MKGTVKNKWVHGSIIATFVVLYFMVSIISTIHVIDFFKLSNPTWLAISLAIAFEIGAAASLAAIIILEKTSRFMVWSLFLILTAMQAMGNTYYAFINLVDFQGWVELFGLVDAEPIAQKRILSIVSGAILPIVALGFIKSLVDYIRPDELNKKVEVKDNEDLGFLGEETKIRVEKKDIDDTEEFPIIDAALKQYVSDGYDDNYIDEEPIEELEEEVEVPYTMESMRSNISKKIQENKEELEEVEVPSPHYSPQPPLPPVEVPEPFATEVELHRDTIEKIQPQRDYNSLKKIGKDWIT